MPTTYYTCPKCKNESADYGGTCHICRNKMGKWETVFYDYECLMNALGFNEQEKTTMIVHLFKILNDGSFRYQWISDSVRRNVVKTLKNYSDTHAIESAKRLEGEMDEKVIKNLKENEEGLK